MQLTALKRSSRLGKKKWEHVSVAAEQAMNDNMRQQIQTLVLCFIPVSLSIVATLVCLNEKGKVEKL